MYLPELDLWLDPHSAKQRAFVSHAHFDHFARHELAITSDVNAVLMQNRFRLSKERLKAHAFRSSWEERGFRIELLPAGHIWGSAMIHLTRLNDGATLLYTGDYKLRQGLAAEPCELKPADIFITETTFALPKYAFPPEQEIQNAILRFVHSSFDEQEIPILYGYSLGKAQEIIALLEKNGVSCLQHKTVAAMTEACRAAGLQLNESQVFDKEVPANYALVCPPNAVRSLAIRRLKNKRTAMCTGWAMNANAHYRYQTDAAFPLSDHADYPSLMEAVRQVNPKLVLTLHGSAREFATDLRSQGIEAWSVFGNDQMELAVYEGQKSGQRKNHPRPESPLQLFSDLCQAVESASGKIEKTRLIADYLKSLNAAELPLVATWLSGRIFSRPSIDKQLNVGGALIRQSLLQAAGASLNRYKEISATQNEASRTARLLLEEADLHPQARSLIDIHALLNNLADTKGSVDKSELLAHSFRSLHPQESESLVKIVTGSFRIGSKEGILEEAVAEAFSKKVTDVRKANMLIGDLGEVATLSRDDRLQEAKLRPFAPIKVMLASPEETAEDIYTRLGEEKIWLEDKYDGIRAQLHKKGEHVSIYSRDLRKLDKEFPELIESLKHAKYDFILDGEIIAYAEGRKLTFFDLQKRLGRTKGQGDLFLGEAIPVRFIAFDILYSEGNDLLDFPLSKRREVLEQMPKMPSLEMIHVSIVDSSEQINEAFKQAKQAGNEGLIAKDADSLYTPGRRGKNWLKLKKAMPTLDCVVVKAQQGHGRRAEVLSDYTFAVKDEESGELRIIGKAYSGLTDLEIEELTEHFKENTLEKTRRVHTVIPNTVLEIAFDSINKSKRHDSGLAMRFPRIKAIRRDKTVEDIDTLAYAQSLL